MYQQPYKYLFYLLLLTIVGYAFMSKINPAPNYLTGYVSARKECITKCRIARIHLFDKKYSKIKKEYSNSKNTEEFHKFSSILKSLEYDFGHSLNSSSTFIISGKIYYRSQPPLDFSIYRTQHSAYIVFDEYHDEFSSACIAHSYSKKLLEFENVKIN